MKSWCDQYLSRRLIRTVSGTGNRTFRYVASSPPKRFATTLDDSLPGRFATGRQTSSYSIMHYRLWDRWRNVQGGSETSWYRNVQRCETSRWRIIQVANCPGSEANRPGIKSSKGNVQVANWQSIEFSMNPVWRLQVVQYSSDKPGIFRNSIYHLITKSPRKMANGLQ